MKDWSWRDWKDWVWLLGVVGMVVNALIALGPGYSSTWDWVGRNSSNIASWVQAVGSIAAILAGFRVARNQVAAQRKDQAMRDWEAHRSKQADGFRRLDARLVHIETGLESCQHWLKGKRVDWPHMANTLADLRRLIGTVGPLETPSPGAVVMFTALRFPIESLARIVEKAAQADPDGSGEDDLGAAVSKVVAQVLDYVHDARVWAGSRIEIYATDAEKSDFQIDLDALGGVGELEEVVADHLNPSDIDQSQSPPPPEASPTPTADSPPTSTPGAQT